VNPAFFEACERCGVDPLDLEPRPLKSFRRQTDLVEDEKVLKTRLEGFEQVTLSACLKKNDSHVIPMIFVFMFFEGLSLAPTHPCPPLMHAVSPHITFVFNI
jgi:hypothetical protein